MVKSHARLLSSPTAGVPWFRTPLVQAVTPVEWTPTRPGVGRSLTISSREFGVPLDWPSMRFIFGPAVGTPSSKETISSTAHEVSALDWVFLTPRNPVEIILTESAEAHKTWVTMAVLFEITLY